jgi:uncharacterized repeat protein (TIGR03803 family)
VNPESLFLSMLRDSRRKLTYATILVCALTLFAGGTADGQIFTVLHSFTGGADGSQPGAGLIQDATGAMYGTTYMGGSGNLGVAYKLTHLQFGWVVTTLAEFGQDVNGNSSVARLTAGPDAVLYGTATFGGNTQCALSDGGCGTVFRLSPTTSFSHTAIYQFSGPPADGAFPESEVTFDREGNIFGTTVQGGVVNQGTVFELIRSGNGWTESVLHNFTYNYINGEGYTDGAEPVGGLILDSGGNLYGTTYGGGDRFCGCGEVFELSPSAGGWTYRVLHIFTPAADGELPTNSLIMDAAGNMYGTTSWGGPGGGAGTVFELSPSGNNWNFSTIYTLPYMGGEFGEGPMSGVIMDAAGNLYGTTFGGGAYSQGSVFKLTPTNGGWEFTSLHDFLSPPEGKWPLGNLLMDASGNLFGTTTQGGDAGDGTVWEITP